MPILAFIRNDIITQLKLAENNKDRQLFLDKNGNYVKPNNARRNLKGTLEKMRIHNISSHCLRHTFCTRCIKVKR